LESDSGKQMEEEDDEREEEEPQGAGRRRRSPSWPSPTPGEGGSESSYGLQLGLESLGGCSVYGEPEGEGRWGRRREEELAYPHGGGGVSGFTSNFRRSKSLRYSMARGLGGREDMGREGGDMGREGGDMGREGEEDMAKERTLLVSGS